jgi:prepilin peptidase CpaA
MVSWTQVTPLVVAILFLLPAAFLDIRFRRIPNWLSLGGFLVGCVAQGLIVGLEGMGFALGAGFLLLAMLFPFFVLGWLGAGDVKLIAAVGAICGTFTLALKALAAIVIVGALIALLVLAWRKGLKKFLERVFYSLALTVMTRRVRLVESDEELGSGDLPYAVAIAIGGIAVLLAETMGLSYF